MRERWLWVPVALLPALTLGPLAALRFVDVDEGSYAAAAKLALTASSPIGISPTRRHRSSHTSTAPGRGARRALARHPFAVTRSRSRDGTSADTASLRSLRASFRVARERPVRDVDARLHVVPTVKTFALATALAFGAYVLDRERLRQGRAPGSPPAHSPRSPCRRARSSSARRSPSRGRHSGLDRGLLRYAWASRSRSRPRSCSSRSIRARSCSATSACTACGAKAASSVTSSRRQRSSPTCSESRPTRGPCRSTCCSESLRLVAGDRRAPQGAARSALVPRRRAARDRRASPDTDLHAVLRDDDAVPDGRGRRARARHAARPAPAAAGLCWPPSGSSSTSGSRPSTLPTTSGRRAENRPPRRRKSQTRSMREPSPAKRCSRRGPGYLFGTHAKPVPGLENDFGPHDAEPLTPEQMKRYHLITDDRSRR